jgi:hypothetical protein
MSSRLAVAALVLQGSGLDRPRLDDGEHAVMLKAVGASAPERANPRI